MLCVSPSCHPALKQCPVTPRYSCAPRRCDASVLGPCWLTIVASRRLVTWLSLRPALGQSVARTVTGSCVVILSTRYWHGSMCGAICLEINDCRDMNEDRDGIMEAPACAKRCVPHGYCVELLARRVLRMYPWWWVIVHLFYSLLQLYCSFVFSPASLNWPTLTHT